MLRPDKSGLSMTVSGRSRERRSAGPLLSTVRLGQPLGGVLTSRIGVFGHAGSGLYVLIFVINLLKVIRFRNCNN
jgi:hypothetical protein